jgi:hypothetical protein
MKFCKDCRWFMTRPMATCTQPLVQRAPAVNLVTGETEQIPVSCETARADPQKCGEGGQYWQPGDELVEAN